MAVDIRYEHGGKVIDVRLTGKLDAEDYEELAPVVDRVIEEHGAVRMLVEMHNFHGWSVGALWEDTKLAVKHFSDIERIAFVGETRWQKGMASFCKPFTKAEVRFFELADIVEAETWLHEGLDCRTEDPHVSSPVAVGEQAE
jgi:hypothetical protein